MQPKLIRILPHVFLLTQPVGAGYRIEVIGAEAPSAVMERRRKPRSH